MSDLPSSFEDLIRTSDKPVLVDFWAEWCGPCRMVSPVVQRIAGEYAGKLLTVKINTDRKPAIAQRYQIHSLPTIMLFWQGEERMRLVGAHPYENIKRELETSWP